MSRMPVLADVNLLLAYGWRSHPRHIECRAWFRGLPKYATCAITGLGFLRVSMSPAYRATFEDAARILSDLTESRAHVFLECNLPAAQAPPVDSHKDTTDSYLVALARRNSMRFATLDEGILAATWAEGVAFHPFR